MNDDHEHSITTWANSIVAKIYRRLGSNSKAISYLKRVQASCDHPSHAYDYGNLLSRMGALKEADKLLTLSSAQPGAPAIWLYRHALVLERLKRYGAALELLRRASDEDSRCGEYRYRSGACLAALGRHEEAFYQLETAIDLNPGDTRAAKRIVGSLPESVPLWRRLAVLDRAIETESADERLLLTHARSAYWIGDFVKAVHSYERTGEIEQLDHEDAYRLAIALEELKANPTFAFARAIATSKSPLVKRLGIGALHEERNDPIRAQSAYMSEWEDGDRSSEKAFRIGIVHERLYHYTEAKQWFEVALGIDPTQAYHQYKFALSAEKLKQYRTASEHYIIAVSLSAKEERYWKYRAGICLLNIGERTRATKYLIQSYGGQALPISSTCEKKPQNRLASTSFKTTTADEQWRRLAQTRPRVLQSAGSSHFLNGEFDAAADSYQKLTNRVEIRNHEAIVKAARSFELTGSLSKAEEVLINGRDFRNPDGLNVKEMTKKPNDRRISLYAEYLRNLPVDSQTILYESYWGTNLSCHPLAIYREIRKTEAGRTMFHVWVVQKSASVPEELLEDEQVILVSYGSDRYLKYLATSKYLINNTSFVPYFTRREQQRYMNTWHGTPIKTLGRSVKGDVSEHANVSRNLLQATHIISPNEHTRKVLLKDFDIAGLSKAPIKVLGSPRLDRVVTTTDEDKRAVRAKLGIDDNDDRRVVLYAPTWRGTNSNREVDVAALKTDLEALESIEDYLILFRGHHLTESHLANTELSSKLVSRHIDTYTLLQAVDVLVTDYSSLIFDFLVTGSRVIAYVPDEEQYSVERGLYFPPSDIVSEVARNRNELCDLVRSSIAHQPDETYMRARNEFAKFEDGDCSKRAVEFLFSDDEYDRFTGSKPTIGFFASLFPNGITSALRDLINAIPESKIRIVLMLDARISAAEDIREFISQLDRSVQILTRDSDALLTLEERRAYSDLKRWRKITSDRHRRILQDGFARELRRMIGDASIDSLMQFEGYASYWTALFAVAGSVGATSSIYLHNEMENELKHKYPYLREVFQWLDDYDNVATVSRPVAAANEHFLKSAGYLGSSRSVYWLRNVIDVDRVRSMADAPADDESIFAQPLIVAAGRLSYEKNHQLLVRMMPKLLERAPEAKLIILGDGPLKNTLESLIAKLDLKAHVTLLGHAKNPYPYIRQADVFVLPSLHEGQPVVLYEAMALDTPFVAAPTPGTEEVAASIGASVVPATVDSFVSAILDRIGAQGSTAVDLPEMNSEALARFLTLFTNEKVEWN